ncbi:MAG: hypothetical protein WCS65_08845 [Verrucomicrobiae bacterium]
MIEDNTYLCMRTTIDMPDDLMARARPILAQRGMTFRALVIDAVEYALEAPAKPFHLRDASSGVATKKGVSVQQINRAINENRMDSFRP